MAPDTTRTNVLVQQLYERIASLQRELAEAMAACRQAVDAMRDYPAYPEDADADKLAAARKRCEMVLAPGSSDAKGEKLTPLTSPIVRGVLVDDGEPTNYPPVRSFFIHPERGLMMSIAGRTEAVVQPVRLRPASEFGVPAEPAQKLVPLPEGARVIVPHDMTAPGFKVAYLNGYWQLLDPALYGVDAERAWDQTELHKAQCESIGLRAEVERQSERIASLTSAAETAEAEAERLRKAIEEHRGSLMSSSIGGSERDRKLWSAIAVGAGGARDVLSSLNVDETASAPAAESEGPDWDVRSSKYRATVVQRDQALARLAACEERCKELECACRKASGILEPTIRGHVVSNLAKSAFDTLQGVLAPKAEGAGDGN